MNTNDALLDRLIALDERERNAKIVTIQDYTAHNPKHIELQANEVVFVHFFHSNNPEFEVQMVSPTQVIRYKPNNTKEQSSNQIVKCLETVKFNTSQSHNFYVQYVKVSYK